MSEDKKYAIANFESLSVEEVKAEFDKMTQAYTEKKFGVLLTENQIAFVNNVLNSAKWKGTECFAVSALRNIYLTLKADKVVPCDREEIRALFHYLNAHEDSGVENVDIAKSTLESISNVIHEISTVETELSDAALELAAKEQGILPEEFAKNQQLELEQNGQG